MRLVGNLDAISSSCVVAVSLLRLLLRTIIQKWYTRDALLFIVPQELLMGTAHLCSASNSSFVCNQSIVSSCVWASTVHVLSDFRVYSPLVD
jgi:hypothetical protein